MRDVQMMVGLMSRVLVFALDVGLNGYRYLIIHMM